MGALQTYVKLDQVNTPKTLVIEFNNLLLPVEHFLLFDRSCLHVVYAAMYLCETVINISFALMFSALYYTLSLICYNQQLLY